MENIVFRLLDMVLQVLYEVALGAVSVLVVSFWGLVALLVLFLWLVGLVSTMLITSAIVQMIIIT